MVTVVWCGEVLYSYISLLAVPDAFTVTGFSPVRLPAGVPVIVSVRVSVSIPVPIHTPVAVPLSSYVTVFASLWFLLAVHGIQ